MWLWIEPLDVLLFRDSRPFTGGETHRAHSLFPPTPLTFQGAIRALLLTAELEKHNLTFVDYRNFLRKKTIDKENASAAPALQELIQLLGDTESFGQLKLWGPFIAHRRPKKYTPFFPLPFDIFLVEESGEPQPVVLTPLCLDWKEKPSWDNSWPCDFLPLWSKQRVEEAPTYWLTHEGLKGYLLGESEEKGWLCKATFLYQREPRFGIKLQRGSRTVEQGMLYMADFIRLEKEVGFLLKVEAKEVSLDSLKEAGIMALGGEARPARYEKLSLDPLSEVFDLGKKVIGKIQNYFKLYLVTPAIFRNGWKPDFLDQNLEGSVNGTRVKLVAAAVGKPVPLGGWDLALGWPKPLWRAVPPGSVYYFQLLDGKPEVLQKFHFECELQGLAKDERLKELAKIGFGFTLVGVVKEEKLEEQKEGL